MRILFHVTNGVGLGHINRGITIAKSLKKIMPDIDIKFISSTDFREIFDINGMKYEKCPHMTKENFESDDFNGEILRLVEDFDPDICIYDTHYPKFAIEKDIGRINILIWRKVTDRILKETLDDSYLFSKIIIPHEKEEFFRGLSKGAINKLESCVKFYFCGPVVRELNDERVKEVKGKYGITEKDYIITAFSGGGGQYPGTTATDKYFEECVSAFDKIKNKINNLKFILVKGPLSDKKIESHDKRLIVEGFEPSLLELMSLSDLVISRAGYNSINEIMSVGVNAIVMEIKCTFDDQAQRAKYLAEKSSSKYIEKYEVLDSSILEFYNSRKKQTKCPFVPGNDKIAKEIKGILDAMAGRSRGINSIRDYFLIGRVYSADVWRDILISKKNPDYLWIKEVIVSNKGLKEFFPRVVFNKWFSGTLDFARFVNYIHGLIDGEKDVERIYKEVKKSYKIGRGQIKSAIDALAISGAINANKGIIPKEITFSLTNRCNLKCKMCDLWKENKKHDLPINRLKEVLKNVPSCECVCLTGGELLLREDVKEVYFEIRNCLPDVHINFSTNGYLTDKLKELITILDRNVSFTVSIDGVETHDSQRGVSGSFKKCLESVNVLLKNDIKTDIKMTITPFNYMEIKKVYELSKSLGVGFQVKPAMIDKSYTNRWSVNSDCFVFSEEMLESIEEQLEEIKNDSSVDSSFINMIPRFLRGLALDFKCRCPRDSLFVMDDGKAYSCLQCHSVGDVLESDVEGVLFSEMAKKIVEEKFENCSKCLSYYGSRDSIEKKDFKVLLINPGIDKRGRENDN